MENNKYVMMMFKYKWVNVKIKLLKSRRNGMKNIYQMLNYVKTNLDGYEKRDFSKAEVKKWTEKVKKQTLHKTRKKHNSI